MKTYIMKENGVFVALTCITYFYNHPLSTFVYGINFSEPRILL